MPEKKKNEQSEFTVTDRRLFTSEGELRSDVTEEVETSTPAASASTPVAPSSLNIPAAAAENSDGGGERDMPLPPTAAEQDAQAAAYRQSSNDLDSQVELSG